MVIKSSLVTSHTNLEQKSNTSEIFSSSIFIFSEKIEFCSEVTWMVTPEDCIKEKNSYLSA
jgi:hypothetical protein